MDMNKDDVPREPAPDATPSDDAALTREPAAVQEPAPALEAAPPAAPVAAAAPPVAPAVAPAVAPTPVAALEHTPVAASEPAPVAPRGPAPRKLSAIEERPEAVLSVPRTRLAAQTRRDFLLYGAGVAAAALGAWWLLPSRTKSHLPLQGAHDALDTLAARAGLTSGRRSALLERSLTFDDDVAEALYSKDRSIRTYAKSEVTPLRNNYDGMTPTGEYLPTWQLQVSGLASGRLERFTMAELAPRFALHEQTTRFVCVEGWSAIAWWGGIRFADFLQAFPPAPGAKWAALRSAVNLDAHGHPDPYYVSIDLATARHPQTLLATHLGGQPLPIAHGAPMRLLVPMKLGLKNIKAITEIAYTAKEPADYWNERGYSRYDGL